MRWFILCLLGLSLQALYLHASMLISSPFDNFRIECPQSSGAQRVSVRMVGSQGFRRQDIVFGLSCRPINELYPWWGIPQGIAELEREDCRYSTMFDPIVDTSGNYSCGPREYLAGISRIADTRVQLECCRMRTRDEKNCVERKFAKPFGNDPRTEIEHQGKLINSIKTEHHTFKVRFCDLVPRAVEMIFEDVPPTTTSRLTTTQPLPPTTPFIQDNIMQENKLLPEQSINEASQTDEAQLVSNRKVIRVFRPSSLVSSGAGQWSTAEPTLANQIEVTSSSTTSEQPEIIEPIDRKEEEVALPDEVQFAGIEPKQRLPAPEVHGNSAFDHSLTEAQKIAHKIIARVKSGEGIESEQMAEQLVKEIESQNDPKAADELFKQSIATLNEYVDDKNMTEQDEDVLDVDSTVDMNFPPVQLPVGESPQFVLLKPIEQRRAPPHRTDSQKAAKGEIDELLEEAPFDQFPTPPPRKQTLPPRGKFPSRPVPTIRITTPRASTTYRYHPRNQDNSPYVDEETVNSPFDYENRERRKVIPRMRRPIPPSPESFEEPSTTRRTVSKPKSALPVFDRLSPFDFGFSHDIRRAPQRFPTHKTTSHPLYDDEMIFPAFDDENSIDPNKEYVEVDLPRLLKDGTKSHLPADGKPMKMPELIVYDTLNPRNVPSFKKAKGTQPPGIPLRLLAAAPPAGPAPPGTQPRETLVPMNALKSASHINAPAPIKSTPASTSTKTSSMTMTTTRTTTTTPLPMTTEAQPEYENELGSKQQESNVEYEMSAESVPTYDPSKFYHTLPPKRYNQRENILTFCTKDVAIRDSNNLVIACGGEHDVWQPPRCPAGTDCFYASDSTYRICCAVSSG